MLSYNKTNVVSLYDYSEYDERRCHTGGAYGYRRDYIRTSENSWRVEHWTTCGCCPVCGAIGEDCDCADNYEVVTTEDLVVVINEFEELVNYWGTDVYWIEMW